MRQLIRTTLLFILCLLPGSLAHASSFLPITTDQHIQIADAIFRGEVVALQSYQDATDGQVYTTANIRVDEIFKGKLPPVVKLTHRGGTFGNLGETDGFAPQFKIGEEHLFFVSRRGDGTLYATHGTASALKLSGTTTSSLSPSVTAGDTLLVQLRKITGGSALSGGDLNDQAASAQTTSTVSPSNNSPSGVPVVTATNLLVDANGIPARFVVPDRGEAIPYLIDADYLPAGITQTQAVAAVQTALAAWSAVTSVKYTFAGIQSFGMAAANVVNSDGMLRIQLHDHYNYIGSGSGSGDTLGVGGHRWTVNTLSTGWTTGGNVNGSDFHKVVNGYLVLAHTNVVMQTLSLFSEVLCHEIGHTIGLAHSSENPSESNQLLKLAIMYYSVHGSGRGATLGAYDPPVARQIHPLTNTPPYMYDRLIDAVTAPVRPLTAPGINAVQLRAYDLQTTNLPIATTDATANAGTFSLVNSNLTFLPNGYYGDSTRIDPTTGSYYDVIYARASDGTNASAFSTVRVAALYADGYSEGLPDSWRTTYFGNANPSVGVNHHATNDADGDGYSNVQEFLLGSNPTNKTSNLRITSFGTTNLQWQAKAYEVYELYGSTNVSTAVSNWVRVGNPIVPTNTIGTVTSFTNGGPKQFFRIQKVP